MILLTLRLDQLEVSAFAFVYWVWKIFGNSLQPSGIFCPSGWQNFVLYVRCPSISITDKNFRNKRRTCLREEGRWVFSSLIHSVPIVLCSWKPPAHVEEKQLKRTLRRLEVVSNFSRTPNRIFLWLKTPCKIS